MRDAPSGSDALPGILDDAADAVIVTDADTGEVVAVNDAVERVFGHQKAAFSDLDPDAYAANPGAASDARGDARRTATESGAATYRWTAVRRDGTTFRAESSVSTTTVDDRACFVAVVRDVSDRAERERELERFAEVLTHDLRSPLNAAEAQVEILRSEVDGGEEWLDRLESVHDRMADIVDDVRTLVSGDRHVGDTKQIDLNEAVEETWDATVDDRADGVELVVSGDLGRVDADPKRLCRLLENLFENAVRHGGDGVTVTVGSLNSGDGIAVEDDGPGIPADARDRVFEYGYTTATAGTGFGLNIVAAAAEAHGWEVGVTEGREGGARFEITGMDRVEPVTKG
ncbi:PAS domain-containing sensor histidine kinase [Halobellus ruber]|uniref:histidine kinase n=1 Tax=Halobellus ruber TaxID=2761102 RepID=A0A7J9SMY2_9EURY|nr:PAS domain-containing sensor histidine kinase [Halobellus ruber]MBB6647519.1 PAS domain-containing sensor histidine kinase [Halobellus ruber]